MNYCILKYTEDGITLIRSEDDLEIAQVHADRLAAMKDCISACVILLPKSIYEGDGKSHLERNGGVLSHIYRTLEDYNVDND